MMIDEIETIEEIGEMETIDIQVSGNHLFFANGILTHNSGYGQMNVEMDNIADSMGIAHTSDLIISLSQPEELKENNQMKFEVIKSRISQMGGKGIVNINHDKMRIENVDEDQDIAETISLVPSTKALFLLPALKSVSPTASARILPINILYSCSEVYIFKISAIRSLPP